MAQNRTARMSILEIRLVQTGDSWSQTSVLAEKACKTVTSASVRSQSFDLTCTVKNAILSMHDVLLRLASLMSETIESYHTAANL